MATQRQQGQGIHPGVRSIGCLGEGAPRAILKRPLRAALIQPGQPALASEPGDLPPGYGQQGAAPQQGRQVGVRGGGVRREHQPQPAVGLLPGEIDAVLPVPLHWRRQALRGFNQAAEIARPLCRQAGLPWLSGVARSRNTPYQSGLSAGRRQRNLHNAFRVHGRIACRHVLVVDDAHKTASSRVAAGLVNPLAGMRFGRRPELADWLRSAQATYDALAALCGEPLFHALPMLRLFRSAEQQRFHARRVSEPGAEALLGPAFGPSGCPEPVHAPHGGFIQQHGHHAEQADAQRHQQQQQPWHGVEPVQRALEVGQAHIEARVADLEALDLGPKARLRLVTNMRIYWDRIAVAEAVTDGEHGRLVADDPHRVAVHAGEADDDNERRMIRRRWEDIPLPSTLPAYETLHIDRTGHLWVERFEVPGAPERTWSVFADDGAWLGDVKFPDRFSPLEIGDDYVLGRFGDELDVEHIQVWELVKPAG